MENVLYRRVVLFLSYMEIFNIINVDKDVLDELFKIQKFIFSGKNYFKNDLSFWEKRYKSHRKGALKTREKLSSCICNDLLGTAKGAFSFTKDRIGSCWISDCCDTKLYEGVCNKCEYKLKNSSFRKKVEDLDKNSISSFGLPFSTIFYT